MTETLQTQRTTLRRVRYEDWQALMEVWKDFSASPYVFYDKPHPTDEKGAQERVARWALYDLSLDHQFWAVCTKEKLIGYVSMHRGVNGYEMGYGFLTEAQGKGYACESIAALMEYLRQKGVKRIVAGTAIMNAPSVRLLYRLGFVMLAKEELSFYRDDAGNEKFFEGGIFERRL